MKTSVRGFILAGAAGLLVHSGIGAAHDGEHATQAKVKVKCEGVNSCKGKGDCASGNQCKGNNSCEGQGYLRLTPEECKSAEEKIKQQGPFDF